MKKRPSVLLTTAEMGCKPNAIQLSRVARYLRVNDIPLAESYDDADFVLVNTCGFDVEHERITLDAIDEMFRRKRPDAKVLSAGCLNVINRSVLEERFPDLTILESFETLDELLQAGVPFDRIQGAWLDEELMERFVQRGGNQTLRVQLSVRYARMLARAADRFGTSHLDRLHFRQILEEFTQENKVFVQIGSGCVGRCNYCVIKKVKDAPVSREPDAILQDIRQSLKPGRVVNLVADDCGSYGVDSGSSLFDLVQRIGQEFPGLPLDLCYVNPFWLQRYPEEYLEMFGTARIHSANLSIQSGNQRLVTFMNRHYDVAFVLELLQRLREVSPSTMFWTHFLVNHPTETWPEFLDTLRISSRFDMYYTFIYSHREGTVSSRMDNENPDALGWLKKKLLYLRLTGRLLNFGAGAILTAGAGS